MTSILRINHFAAAANEAFTSSTRKYLCADEKGKGVRLLDCPWFFFSQAKAENKKTWKIFRECLVETIGQRKFDWICHRYRYQLNFSRMVKSGKALLPDHVELFSVGISQVKVGDLKFKSREKIKTLCREQIAERLRSIQPFPLVGGYKDPDQISGSPSSFLAYFFHDKLLMDKEKQVLSSDVSQLSFSAWLERMSKVMASRELLEGQLIPAPGEDGRVDYYKVYRKICGGGLVSYALRPSAVDSTLKPLIVFRPALKTLSSEDVLQTYLNDLEPNRGERGWLAAKKKFETLMNDSHFRRNAEKVILAGQGLGAAHAEFFAEEHAGNVLYTALHDLERRDGNFWYERMRRLGAAVIVLSFDTILLAASIFSKVFGIRILRSSEGP